MQGITGFVAFRDACYQCVITSVAAFVNQRLHELFSYSFALIFGCQINGCFQRIPVSRPFFPGMGITVPGNFTFRFINEVRKDRVLNL